jgi:hypothetical protein
MSGFVFTLNSFAIDNTRAVHDDTDYASLGLSVNGVPITPQVKRVGNVNNGTHQVNLTIPLATWMPSVQQTTSSLYGIP